MKKNYNEVEDGTASLWNVEDFLSEDLFLFPVKKLYLYDNKMLVWLVWHKYSLWLHKLKLRLGRIDKDLCKPDMILPVFKDDETAVCVCQQFADILQNDDWHKNLREFTDESFVLSNDKIFWVRKNCQNYEFFRVVSLLNSADVCTILDMKGYDYKSVAPYYVGDIVVWRIWDKNFSDVEILPACLSDVIPKNGNSSYIIGKYTPFNINGRKYVLKYLIEKKWCFIPFK